MPLIMAPLLPSNCSLFHIKPNLPAVMGPPEMLEIHARPLSKPLTMNSVNNEKEQAAESPG